MKVAMYPMRAPNVTAVQPLGSVIVAHRSALKLNPREGAPVGIEREGALKRLKIATRFADHLASISIINLDNEQSALVLIIARDHHCLRVLYVRAKGKLNELGPLLSACLSASLLSAVVCRGVTRVHVGPLF
jgi:hypothetical protein